MGSGRCSCAGTEEHPVVGDFHHGKRARALIGDPSDRSAHIGRLVRHDAGSVGLGVQGLPLRLGEEDGAGLLWLGERHR